MFWVAPYGIRTFDVAKDVAGLYIGLPAAAASAAGVIIGGPLSDIWTGRDVRGRVYVCQLAIVLRAPFAAIMFAVDAFALSSVLRAVLYLFNHCWTGWACTAYPVFVLPRDPGPEAQPH